ncbi:MAG: hypothetical protein O2807_11690, partial [bacterium]|nr:hypothetical protein [bacterium]
MKILLSTPHQGFYPATGSHDFYTGIRSLGHEVEVFFYRKKSFFYSNFRKSWVRWMNRRLAEKCITENFDLLFVYRDGYIQAETIAEIRRKSACRTVCFYPDNPYGSTAAGISFDQIGAYDLFLTMDTYFFREFDLFGFGNVAFTSDAYDPSTYEKEFTEAELAPYRSDVAFIGSYYGFREVFFSGLTDEGVDFKIWGPQWRRARDPWIRERATDGGVYGDEKLKIIKASKIVLDIQSGGGHIETCDDKTMSFIGGGAFFLTNHKKNMDLVFKVGEEIETFQSKKELQEKIR